jgi:lysophosphatidate acyltransferase
MEVFATILLYVILPYIAIALALYMSAIYILPTRPGQLAEFGARAMGYILALLICAIYGMVASVALKVIGKGGLGQWTSGKAFKWISYPMCGVWFDIEGDGMKRLEEVRPAVLVGNHQT